MWRGWLMRMVGREHMQKKAWAKRLRSTDIGVSITRLVREIHAILTKSFLQNANTSFFPETSRAKSVALQLRKKCVRCVVNQTSERHEFHWQREWHSLLDTAPPP